MPWRPWDIAEAWWAGGGALLSELARAHGVFDWVSAKAVRWGQVGDGVVGHDFGDFLRLGVVAMPVAMLAALAGLLLMHLLMGL